DTTTGTLLRTFANPDLGPGDQFGRGVAFFDDGRIAISAPGAGYDGVAEVYIYDDAADAIPTVVNDPFATGVTSDFGRRVAGLGDFLLVSAPSAAGGAGSLGTVAVLDGNGTLRGQLSEAGAGALGSVLATRGDRVATVGLVNSASVVFDYQFTLDPITGDPVFSTPQVFEQPAGVVGPTGGSFGYALAYGPDSLFISAPFSSLDGSASGLVMQYALDDGAVSYYENPAPTTFDGTTPQLLRAAGDFFGGSLIFTGDKLIAAAPGQTVVREVV